MALVSHTTKRGGLSFELTGQAAHSADAAGTLGYIQNPEDVPIIVKSCYVYAKTNSTGAANLTIGHATTVAGAHDTTQLLAATALAAAAGKAITGFANGDAADELIVVPADSYICAFASATTVGFTGTAYLDYDKVI
jgi:hypothetical protein